MDIHEAQAYLRGAAGELAWIDSRGHPDDVRIAALEAHQQAAQEAIDVIGRAAYAAGRAAAFREGAGQMSL